MKEKLKRFAVVWTIGIIGGFLFWALVITGRIKLSGYRQILKLVFRMILTEPERGVLLYFRHTSFYDPAPLPFFFFPWYLFFIRFISYSIPDRTNYYIKKGFWLFRSVCIAIDRSSERAKLKALYEMRAKLRQGGVVNFPPGGGREFNGKEWKRIDNGRITVTQIWDENAKIIRRFQGGIGLLAKITGAIILPVWTEGGEKIIPNLSFDMRFSPESSRIAFPRMWRQMKIKIGKPVFPDRSLSRKEIDNILEDIMLTLGEE